MNSEKNKSHEPFLLVLGALTILLIFSFAPFHFLAGSFEIHPVNILADISAANDSTRIKPYQVIKTSADSSSDKKIQEQAHLEIPIDQYPGIIQFGTDSTGGLRSFFIALNKLGKGKKKVRIAYFGDSMIEGDLITQDFRSLLQDKFGGDGVGFMPVTSIVAGFRQSIIHSFSPNWKDLTLLDAVSAEHGLGITGHTFIPYYSSSEKDSFSSGNESWVKYTAVGRKRLNRFGSVRLFYGKSDAGNSVSLNQSKSITLSGTSLVNEVCLYPNAVQGFKATFNCDAPLNVYGFTMESDSGVVLDNLSFRGNSGLPLTKMPFTVLSGLNKYLNYDLIILHYGVNVVNEKVRDYSWYEKGMTEVVRHLQNCFPNASILIIGAGDKSTRVEGQYITDPSIPVVVEAQRRVAKNTHTAFWNFYEAMGGEGSMIKWVKGDTIFANTDYTHFNSRGARKVGNLLYNYLVGEFKKTAKL
ncbi:MAG: GDSL-type esterase/lipase family protein [Bacteroidia bacterium]